MTITEQLENIILKYKLDSAYPRFRNYTKCKKIAKDLFSKYADMDKILLLSSEKDSLFFLLREIEVHCNLEEQIVDVLNLKELDSINFRIYSDIIVLSHDSYREISYELSLRKVKHKCLYDCFAANGLFLDYNYFNIFGGKYLPISYITDGVNDNFVNMNPSYEFFYYYKKYVISQERELKQFYLQRIIFLSLYMRDFISADMYIKIYIESKYKNFELHKKALLTIEKLLSSIKFKISARKDDYFVFLNDCLNYGDKKYTPFLNSINKNSLHFENAYTPTPYTGSSFRSFMLGKLVLDDRSYKMSLKNNFIKSLCEDRNIQFKYFGLLHTEPNVDVGLGKINFNKSDWTVPASKWYWLAIEYLLKSKQQQFIFMHTLIETHNPCCSNNMVGLKNISHMVYFFKKGYKRQKELSIAYADKQLQWYNKFFPQHSTKIYMNDHGLYVGGSPYRSFPMSVQARLNINAPWIKPRKLKGMFNYLNFHKLINRLLDKDLKYLDDLFSDSGYVKIQDLPFYNKLLKSLFDSCSLPSHLFGYRGVVTKQAVYVKYGDGNEFYRNIKISKRRFSKEDIEYLSSIAGNDFLDYREEEKLKLARRNFEILEKYNKRNRLYEEKKSRIFVNLLKNIPKESVVAVRSGGNAAVNLLFKLGPEQQQRISFIIDKNPRCSGAYFGIPVISPQKAKRTKIDVIIAPQNEKDICQEVKKELLKFSKIITVIDVYSFLARRGIICTRNFWEREIIEDDIIEDDISKSI